MLSNIFLGLKISIALILCVCAARPDCFGEERAIPDVRWKEDFDDTVRRDGLRLPAGWTKKATKWGVPETNFSVVKRSGENVLKLKSVKSTGAFLCDVTGKVNLRKTPLLSWRWKAVTLPRGGDGREGGTDDQAVAIYIGTGRVNYKAIGYRWETDTPKGVEETISYGFGRIKIKWFCLRNKTDDLGKWYVERRNIAKDFRKAFGYIPDKLAVSVAGNSQYSGTSAEAEVDWIEFLPLEKKLALRRRNP